MTTTPDPHREQGAGPHRFEQFIDRQHRIFVNRNLRMESIRWVGFDMDHTLALYNRNFIEALAFELAKDALVRECGYPRELAAIRYDPEFGSRGLVVDKELGNILKMDEFHYVAVAYHGRRRLDRESRKALYPPHALEPSSQRFWSSDTLFGLPEIALYAGVVQALEDGRLPASPGFRQLFDDIRNCVDLVHGDGSLKSIILERKSECFLPDPRLPQALAKWRHEGKRLFLLSNSSYAYTDQVLTYVMGGHGHRRPWQEQFDLIVCDARKPAFFLKRKGWQASPASGSLPIYQGGNVRLLEQTMGAKGDEILYVGDHIYGDILRSKKHSGWRTMMIVEELDHEIRASMAGERDRRQLDHLQMRSAELAARLADLERKRTRLLERRRAGQDSLDPAALGHMDAQLEASGGRVRQLAERLSRNELESRELEEQIFRRFSPFWGPLCKVDNELSRFGDQLQEFACLYTARVSNYLFYPPGRYFRSPVEFLPHEI
jgi:HAD superfamily 5'-nucleotidase-like hydrolase